MTDIPWQEREGWSQVELSIACTLARLGPERSGLEAMAREIAGGYDLLDELLDPLCARTCGGCRGVCCTMATVWYDLRDLLVLALTPGGLPDRQIDRDGEGRCRHLSPTGCRLPRRRRPFICTWYICATQREDLAARPTGDGGAITAAISCLRTMRNELEDCFVAAARR